MALIGTREDWTRFAADDPDGPGLKDEHAEWIRATVAEASPDTPLVVVDAATIALLQTAERVPDRGVNSLRTIAAHIANEDER